MAMEKCCSSVPKIDIHTHIVPKEWPNWNQEFGYGGWLTIRHDQDGAKLLNSDGTIFRKLDPNCWCLKTRLKECDSAGVTIQVLSTVPGIGFNYKAPAKDALKVAQFLNDHISGIVSGEFSDRFVGLGTVPLQDCDLAIGELKRCVEDLGLHGVQIGTHINGFCLDNPHIEPFWAEVEKLDCAVFVHPWDMSSEGRAQKYWFPWLLGMPHETAIAMGSLILGGVLERYPKLRLCFAHGGGCFPTLIGRVNHGFHARPDLCQIATKTDPQYIFLSQLIMELCRIFLNKIYVDSLVHDPDILNFLVKKLGQDRIILGSDYPFPLGEIDRPGKLVERMEFSEQTNSADIKEKLLWKNAVEFLRLKVRPF